MQRAEYFNFLCNRMEKRRTAAPESTEAIAAYFGVSEEALLSSTPVEETLSPVKSALVSRIREMSEEDAATLSVIADMLLK